MGMQGDSTRLKDQLAPLCANPDIHLVIL